MSRPRQRDITAIVKATQNAGESIARIEVDADGKVVVYVGDTHHAKQTLAERLIHEEAHRDRLHPKRQRRVQLPPVQDAAERVVALRHQGASETDAGIQGSPRPRRGDG